MQRLLSPIVCLLAVIATSCSEQRDVRDVYESINRIETSISEIFIPSISSNPDSAIAVLRQKGAEETDPLLAKFWKMGEAKSHYMIYQDDSAILKNREVMAFCNSAPDVDGIDALVAESENLSGVLEQLLNNREKACEHYINAYNSAKRTPRVDNLPKYCVNIADNYRMMCRYPEAASWLRQALFVSDSLNLESYYPPIYTQLGQVYSYLKNYEKADEFFEKALPYCQKGDFDNFFYLISKGNSLFSREEYEASLACFREALPIGRSLNVSQEKLVEANICEVFVNMKQIDSAEVYFDKAFEFYNSAAYKDDAVVNHLYGLKGAIELEKNNPKKASAYLSHQIEDARRHGDLDLLHFKRMMRLSEMRGDWKTAAGYAEKILAISDSTSNAILRSNFVEAESRFIRDTTVFHQQLRLSEQTVRIGKLTRYIYSIAILFLLGVILAVVQLYRRQKKELRTERELSILRLESFRKLVSPHYIFNALYAAHPDDRIMKPLTSLIRNSIDTSSCQSIPLHRELEITQDGVTLRKALGRDDIKFSLKINGEIPDEMPVFPGCISTFVENSYKHAFPTSMTDPEIAVTLAHLDGMLYISVKDNGCGFNPDLKKGTGLQNITRIIEILNRYNTRKAEIHICSENGTDVRVSIPDDYIYSIE